MFFWNKYCGLVFLFLGFNTNLFAQNLDSHQLIARSFLSKNILLTHENYDNLFLGGNWLFGQRGYSLPGKFLSSISFMPPADYAITPKNDGLSFNLVLDNLIAFNSLQSGSETQLTKIIPSDFSTCRYGFFCRQELKLEKATNLPLRVRLGSLQQCNYYEGSLKK